MRLGHSYCSSRVVDTISTPPSYLESKQAIEILYDTEEALFPQMVVAMATEGG